MYQQQTTVFFLLAVVLPAAVATVAPPPGEPCEPAVAAARTWESCASGMASARCCEQVVAAADLGGGVPCLCRVAAEPQLVEAGLDAKGLISLYAKCGGGDLGSATICEGTPFHLASEQQGSSPPKNHNAVKVQQLKAVSAYNAKRPETCPTAHGAAMMVALDCGQGYTETYSCCKSMKYAIVPAQTVECICVLAKTFEVKAVRLDARELINIYASCTGMRPGDFHFPSSGCNEVSMLSAMLSPATTSPPGPSMVAAQPPALRSEFPRRRASPGVLDDHALLKGNGGSWLRVPRLQDDPSVSAP